MTAWCGQQWQRVGRWVDPAELSVPVGNRHHRRTRAAGVIDLTSDSGAIIPYGAGIASSGNAGLLTKTTGSGTSNIGAVLNSTGTINATTGTLALGGGGGIGGKITGAGVVGRHRGPLRWPPASFSRRRCWR